MKQIAWYTTLVLSTLTVLVLLWQFREAIVLFLFSLMLAAAFRPWVNTLVARKLPRPLAILLVYAAFLFVLVVIITVVSGAFINEIGQIANRFANYYDRIYVLWPHGSAIQQSIIKNLPSPPGLYKAIAGSQGGAILQATLGITLSSIGIISKLAVILVLSIYWSIDQIHFERLWLSTLPVETRASARNTWREIEIKVGSYSRSEIIQSILAGILLGVGYSLIGLDYPVVLAIVNAIFWFIPWLGGAMAMLLVFMVGLLSGFPMAIQAVLITTVVLLFLELAIEPRITARGQFSSLFVVLVLIAMADVFGIVGIIVAPPLAATIQILFTNIFLRETTDTTVESIRQIANLNDKIWAIKTLAVSRHGETQPEIQNMIDRLSQLVDEANQMIAE